MVTAPSRWRGPHPHQRHHRARRHHRRPRRRTRCRRPSTTPPSRRWVWTWPTCRCRWPRDQVGAAVLGLRALGFRGANVTVPHKAAVVPFLDSLEGDAALIERREHDRRRRRRPARPQHRRGGRASRAARGLRRRAARPQGAAARRRRRRPGGGAGARPSGDAAHDRQPIAGGRGAARGARRHGRARRRLRGGALADRWRGDLVAAQRLLVNATSLGMDEAGKVPAALADNVTAGQVVFDVVYTSAGTDLLAAAHGNVGR